MAKKSRKGAWREINSRQVNRSKSQAELKRLMKVLDSIRNEWSLIMLVGSMKSSAYQFDLHIFQGSREECEMVWLKSAEVENEDVRDIKEALDVGGFISTRFHPIPVRLIMTSPTLTRETIDDLLGQVAECGGGSSIGVRNFDDFSTLVTRMKFEQKVATIKLSNQ